MTRSLHALLAAALLAPALHAAESETKRTLHCRILVISGAVREPWYVRHGKTDYKRIFVSTDYLGAAVPVTAGDKLQVFRKLAVPRKDADGKPVEYEPIAEFTPADAPRQLILLAEHGGKWVGRSYADDERSFPNGAMLVFNVAKSPVALDFGGTRLALKPGESGVLGAPKTVANDSAKIKAMRMTDAGPVTFFDSAWPWLPSRRNIVFVYNDPRTDGIFIKGIDDVREPEPKDKNAKPARP